MSYTAVPIIDLNNFPRPIDDREVHGMQSPIEEIRLGTTRLTGSDSTSHTNSQPHKEPVIQLAHDHQVRGFIPRGRIKRILQIIWLTAWLPAISFAYMALCYAAATRVVPVHVYKVDQPMEHLYGIKAGVTTLSIIVIAIALLPAKSVIDDLKTEEFFRRISKSKGGVPLDVVNEVSTPSNGFTQSFASVFQSRASKYFTGALFSSIVVVMVSALAPAALSVGIISVESEITALRVGALAPGSIYVTDTTPYPSLNPVLSMKATEAASLGWVQSTLGLDMTFRPDSLKYAVPVPLDLTPKDQARWITDVIIMDPVCGWAISDPPIALPADSNNGSAYSGSYMNITLPSYGVGTSISSTNFSPYTNKVVRVIGSGASIVNDLFNLTTQDPPVRGTMAWLLAQCTSCIELEYSQDKARLNFTDIPTQQLSVPPDATTNTTSTHAIAILVCEPRLAVETKEVRMDGGGGIQVIEDGRILVRQGNLPISQTQLLATRSLDLYEENSGPDTGFSGIGRAGQVGLLFGPQGKASETTSLTPLPIEHITKGYNIALQAAMRAYLSGSLGSALVPGRIQTPKLAFTSSLPHVIASTVLFTSIALFVIVCHFRSKSERFTFFSVAAAVAHSNIPVIYEEVRHSNHEGGATCEEAALVALRGRRVRLAQSGKAGSSLILE